MAKLNTYKFVNPGASKTKDSEVVAVRKAVLATNRIGDTVNGISLIVKDLRLVQIAKEKQDDKQEQFIQKRLKDPVINAYIGDFITKLPFGLFCQKGAYKIKESFSIKASILLAEISLTNCSTSVSLPLNKFKGWA